MKLTHGKERSGRKGSSSTEAKMSLSRDQRSVLETDVPNISPRSRLYRLTPEGVGTALVESQASYVLGLSLEHGVWPGDLISKELSQLAEIPLSPFPGSDGTEEEGFFPFANGEALSGWGSKSNALTSALEQATGHDDLGILTMRVFAGCISERRLFSKVRRWCAHCYAECRERATRVYAPLIWLLGAVEVCPLHFVILEDACVSCGYRSAPILGRMQPGLCANCHKELQSPRSDRSSANGDVLDSAIWKSKGTGELLAKMPRFVGLPLAEIFERNWHALIDAVARGNMGEFRRFCDFSAQELTNGSGQKPTLEQLLRACYRCQVSPVSLFRESSGPFVVETVGLEAEEKSPSAEPAVNVHDVLVAALNENPPPTVEEVGGRTGKPKNFLRTAEPELYAKIVKRSGTASRINSGHWRGAKAFIAGPELERLLISAARRKPPESLSAVVRRIGYTDSTAVQRRFPKLTAIIADRHQKHAASEKLEAAETALRSAMRTHPVAALSKVAKDNRFSMEFLTDHCPELCESLQLMRDADRKFIHEDRRQKLLDLVEEAGTLTIEDIEARMGLTASYLIRCFGEEYAAVTAGIHDRMRTEVRQRMERLQTFVRETVREDIRHGRKTSAEGIRQKLPEGCARGFIHVNVALEAALREARSETSNRQPEKKLKKAA